MFDVAGHYNRTNTQYRPLVRFSARFKYRWYHVRLVTTKRRTMGLSTKDTFVLGCLKGA